MKQLIDSKRIAAGLNACDVSRWEVLTASIYGVLASLFRIVSVTLFVPLAYTLLTEPSAPGGKLEVLYQRLPLGDLTPAYLMSGAIFFAGLASAVFSYLGRYQQSRLAHHAQATVSRRVFRRFLTYGQVYFDTADANVHLTQLRRIPRRFARRVKMLVRYLKSALEIIVYGAVLTLIYWSAAMVCFLLMAGYYLLFARLIYWLETLGRPDTGSVDSDYRVSEVVRNLSLVKGTGASRIEKRKWRSHQRKQSKAMQRESRYAAAVRPFIQVMSLLFMLAFMLILASGVGQLGPYDVLRFVAFFLLLRRFMAACSRLLQAPGDWAAYKRDLSRYRSLMRRADKGIVTAGVDRLERIHRPVELKGLSFSYAQTPFFNGLDLSIPNNRCTAVVGRSGCGKSTLLKLLSRQYEPGGGEIRLNGKDICGYSLDSLYSEIIYLGSDPRFFSESIEYNLSYGIGEVSQDELLDALELSGSSQFVSTLEHGLDTSMGGAQKNFSRGQLQRLGMARLLLQRKASLFLLDEATNALDEASESSLIRLMETFPGATVVFATHRTSAIEPGMNVVVLDEGKVVEQGERRVLEASPESFFRSLINATANAGPAS